ncbi:MAG: GIY-YIG nuclease family protein [Planctomycetaceae bacterium]
MSTYFVYIIRCSDGSYYVGHSTDVTERVAAHNSGRGAVWTSSRTPVVLVYEEPFPTEAAAVARERQLKRWTQAKKQALVDGNLARLKELSRSR